MHGYEIHQRMSDPSGLGQVWRLKQSQLYALMGKLEEEGLLFTELQMQDTRPSRKVFHLTSTGSQVFPDWLHSPVEHSRDMRLDFLFKLYFLQNQGNEALNQLIQKQRGVCQGWLKFQAFLAWLDQCQQALAIA